MKRINIITLFILIASQLCSCGSDETGKKKENKLTLDGNTISIPKAFVSQEYIRQDGEGNPGSGFYIAVAEESIFISNNGTNDAFNGDGFVFIIGLAADESEFLLPGTYSVQEGDPFPFIFYGEIAELENGRPGWYGNISSGTVTISKSGDTYTIEIDVMLFDGSIKGYYKGSLEDVTLAD